MSRAAPRAETTSVNAELLRAMAAYVENPQYRIYAVLDGAQFDDLPGALAKADIAHRSLFKNVQDAELVRTGPWLVDPYHRPASGANVWGGLPSADNVNHAVVADTAAALEGIDYGASVKPSFHATGGAADAKAQLETVINLIGDAPAAVFWIGDRQLKEPSLWRHLRTLNMVLIPKEYDPKETESLPVESGNESEDTHDTYLFRHADGNVLSEVLPVLDAAQVSRAFGPAKALVFFAPDYPSKLSGSPVRHAVLPEDSPPAKSGLLKLSMQQMLDIEEIRLERSRFDTMDYLRANAAEETSGMSDDELYREVAAIEKRGLDLGFVSMTAHLLFAFMCISGIGDAVDNDEFREDVKQTGLKPDDALNEVFSAMIHAAETDTGEAA